MNTTSFLPLVLLSVLLVLGLAFTAGFVFLVIRLSQRTTRRQEDSALLAEAPSLPVRLAQIEDAYQQGLITDEERAEARRAALAQP